MGNVPLVKKKPIKTPVPDSNTNSNDDADSYECDTLQTKTLMAKNIYDSLKRSKKSK